MLSVAESRVIRIVLKISSKPTTLKSQPRLNISKDRHDSLGMLLQHVDFQSISVENLLRIGRFSLGGQCGDDLHREADEALRMRERKRSTSLQDFRPRRRCFQHWSPDLGASTEPPGRKVWPAPCNSMCWYEDTIYATDFRGSRVLRLRPGDPQHYTVVGPSTHVAGIKELGIDCDLSISPSGVKFVADFKNRRVVRFADEIGIVLDDIDATTLTCSPNDEALYVVSQYGEAVQKLVGSTLQTVVCSESLPRDMRFSGIGIFVTKEEVIYLSDGMGGRILCIKPGGHFPN